MPIFDKALGIARQVRAFLNPRSAAPRGAAPDGERRNDQARDRGKARRPRSERKKKIRSEIRSKKQELKRKRQGFGAATERAKGTGGKKRKKIVQQEIFELERQLHAAKEGAEGEPVTGSLPDFVVIGAMKGGTTYLYHLLTRHPLVEPAAAKELHFFDSHFDLGIEWYRACFPKPRLKDGRPTITGEATPYLDDTHAPERMAGVVPQARLVALLRDPVDRAFSDYHHRVRHGLETRTFEEAIEAEAARRFGTRHGESAIAAESYEYLSKSVYVDQLLRWSEFFDKEQLLVLKSEDFFENPQGTLKPVLSFLGLPDWEPEASQIVPKKRNKGDYERGMDPATRERLEGYFKPHNRRLYDFLGTDLGW